MHVFVALVNGIAGIAHGEVDALKSIGHGAERNVGCVVVVAQMAQEHVFKPWVIMLLDKLGCHHVIEVAFLATHTVFEIFRIASLIEHNAAVVALYHQVVGLLHVVLGACSDYAHICGHDEFLVAAFYEETHVVGSVVRGFKCSDLQAGELKRSFDVDGLLILLDASRDVVVAQQSIHEPRSAIDANVLVFAHNLVGVAYVVGVVVGQDNAFHHFGLYAVFPQIVEHMVQVNSGIN